MVKQSKEENQSKDFTKLKEILKELNDLSSEDVILMNINSASNKLFF